MSYILKVNDPGISTVVQPLYCIYPDRSHTTKFDVVSGESCVYSYRGKKDLRHAHSFETSKWSVAGEKTCYFRFPSGATGGGVNYMLNYLHLYPLFNISLNSFRVHLDPETPKYLDYMSQRLYAKANDAVWDGSVFVAELLESLLFLSDIVTKARDFTERTKFLIRMGERPHEAWLMYRYAILPIILDVQNIIQVIRKGIMPRKKVSLSKEFGSTYDDMSFNYVASPGNIKVRVSKKTSFSAGASMELDNFCDPHPFGFGDADLVRAAWELVPLSFIFDQMVQVGDFLTTLRDTAFTVGERYCTIKKEVEFNIWIDVNASSAIDLWEKGPNTSTNAMTVSSFSLYRYVNEAIAPPHLPAMVPGGAKLLHTIDDIAVILGYFSNLKIGRL